MWDVAAMRKFAAAIMQDDPDTMQVDSDIVQDAADMMQDVSDISRGRRSF